MLTDVWRKMKQGKGRGRQEWQRPGEKTSLERMGWSGCGGPPLVMHHHPGLGLRGSDNVTWAGNWGLFFSAFRLVTCLSCMQVESPGIQVSMLCSIPKRKADIYLISCRLVHGFAWK